MTRAMARSIARRAQGPHFEVDFFLFLNSCDLARSEGLIDICHVAPGDTRYCV